MTFDGNWEIIKIPKNDKGGRNEATINIAKNGVINFSQTALKELQKQTQNKNIYECPKVALLYNEEAKEYALKFGDEGQMNLLNANKKRSEKYKKACWSEASKILGTGTKHIKRYEDSMLIIEGKEEG